MRRIYWIISIIVVLLILAVIRVRHIKDRIKVSVTFNKIQLQGINLADLISGDASFAIALNVDVWNKNNFTIPIKGLWVDLLYKTPTGFVKIGEEPNMGSQTIKIKPDKHSRFAQVINVYIMDELTNVVREMLSQENPELYYAAGMRVYGIPLEFGNKIQLFNKA